MNNKEILNSIIERSQQTQTVLHSLLSTSMTPSLRASVESLLKEIESIEAEAFSIAASRGWTLNELQPAKRICTSVMTRLRLTHLQSDSSLASAIIQCNIKGIIQCISDQHRITSSDPLISNLLQKHLDCQTANTHQMQMFL